MIRLTITYAEWKTAAATGAHLHEIDGVDRVVYTGTADYLLASIVGEDDIADWQANYESGSTLVESWREAAALCLGLNRPAQPINQVGMQRVQLEPRFSSKTQAFSINFCDKRTWWPGSTRETEIALVEVSGTSGLEWDLPTPGAIVDVNHARIQHERSLRSSYGFVQEKDDGGCTTMSEHHFSDTHKWDSSAVESIDHSAGQADYGVDYATGRVYSKTDLRGLTPRATYSRVGDSHMLIEPPAGKKIILTSAELQSSVSAVINDDFVFEVIGRMGHHVALPATPEGTIVPLVQRFYPTKDSLDNEANGALVQHPADPADLPGGEWSWRQRPEAKEVLQWAYQDQAPIRLYSDVTNPAEAAEVGNGLRICLENDVEAGGRISILTVYGYEDTL